MPLQVRVTTVPTPRRTQTQLHPLRTDPTERGRAPGPYFKPLLLALSIPTDCGRATFAAEREEPLLPLPEDAERPPRPPPPGDGVFE